jgi:hypothetical protein
MKWFERIAQGFNPGSGSRVRCPESGTRCWARLTGQYATSPIGRHFQGGCSVAHTQGLSPGLFCATISWSRAPILNELVNSPDRKPEESLTNTDCF